MGVRDEQFEEPPFETGVMLVRMSVVVVVVTAVGVVVAVVVRVAVGVFMWVEVVVTVVMLVRLSGEAHTVAWSARWCAGIPPSACSAW